MSIDQLSHWLFRLAIVLFFAMGIVQLASQRFLAEHRVRVGWQNRRAQIAGLRSIENAGGPEASRARLLRGVLSAGGRMWLVGAALMFASFLSLLRW